MLTLWRNLDAAQVTAPDMADAITLAQYYLGEALRLADAATISPDIARAETLRKWLLDDWPQPDVLLRDVVRFGPGRAVRESPKARAALALLAQHGWLVPLEPGTVIRGAARKEAWRIVRSADVV